METERFEETLARQTEHATQELLKKVAEDVPLPPPDKAFQPIDHLRNKAVEEMKKEMEMIQNSLDEGLTTIFDVLQNSPGELEMFSTWFETNQNELLELTGENATLDSNESIAKKLKFPNELLTLIYNVALKQEHLGNLHAAIDVLQVCVTLEPNVFDFWFSYGRILDAMHEYEGALHAFQAALMFDSTNASCYAYMAKAWIALNMPEEAKLSLAKALQNSEGKRGVDNFVDYCYALQAYCDKKMKKAS